MVEIQVSIEGQDKTGPAFQEVFANGQRMLLAVNEQNRAFLEQAAAVSKATGAFGDEAEAVAGLNKQLDAQVQAFNAHKAAAEASNKATADGMAMAQAHSAALKEDAARLDSYAISSQQALSLTLAFLTGTAKLAEQTVDYGNKLSNLSQITGMSATALAGWALTETSTGVSAQTAANAVDMFMKRIEEGSPKAVAALRDLGISKAQLFAMNPDERADALAQALAGIADESQRAVIAMELFGRARGVMAGFTVDAIAMRDAVKGILGNQDEIAAAGKSWENYWTLAKAQFQKGENDILVGYTHWVDDMGAAAGRTKQAGEQRGVMGWLSQLASEFDPDYEPPKSHTATAKTGTPGGTSQLDLAANKKAAELQAASLDMIIAAEKRYSSAVAASLGPLDAAIQRAQEARSADDELARSKFNLGKITADALQTVLGDNAATEKQTIANALQVQSYKEIKDAEKDAADQMKVWTAQQKEATVADNEAALAVAESISPLAAAIEKVTQKADAQIYANQATLDAKFFEEGTTQAERDAATATQASIAATRDKTIETLKAKAALKDQYEAQKEQYAAEIQEATARVNSSHLLSDETALIRLHTEAQINDTLNKAYLTAQTNDELIALAHLVQAYKDVGAAAEDAKNKSAISTGISAIAGLVGTNDAWGQAISNAQKYADEIKKVGAAISAAGKEAGSETAQEVGSNIEGSAVGLGIFGAVVVGLIEMGKAGTAESNAIAQANKDIDTLKQHIADVADQARAAGIDISKMLDTSAANKNDPFGIDALLKQNVATIDAAIAQHQQALTALSAAVASVTTMASIGGPGATDPSTKSYYDEMVAKIAAFDAAHKTEAKLTNAEQAQRDQMVYNMQGAGLKLQQGSFIDPADAKAHADIFSAVYWAEIREKGLVAGAEAMTPAFDAIVQSMRNSGMDQAAIDAILGPVEQIQNIIGDPKMKAGLDGLDAATQSVKSIGDAGYETKGAFEGLEHVVGTTNATLAEGGVVGPEAMIALAPSLEEIIQLHQKYGFTIDAATQGLIDQATAAGVTFAPDPVDHLIDAIQHLIDMIAGVPSTVHVNTVYTSTGNPPPTDPNADPDPGNDHWNGKIWVPNKQPGGSAASGGIFVGPDSGYPMTLHGNEAVVPLGNAGAAARVLSQIPGAAGWSAPPSASAPQVQQPVNVTINISVPVRRHSGTAMWSSQEIQELGAGLADVIRLNIGGTRTLIRGAAGGVTG